MARNTEVPEKDYGEPLKFDPDFKGPLHRRSCTDLLCLLIFVVFLACWGATSAYAIMHGDVRRLLVPTDSDGLKCGLDSSVIDKPYLVFFDMTKCISPTVPINGCPTKQVCVKECPNTMILRIIIDTWTDSKIKEMRDKFVCKYHVDKTAIDSKTKILKLMDEEECAENIFESKSILGRCFGDLTPMLCGPGSSVAKSQQQAPESFVNKLKSGIAKAFSPNADRPENAGYSCNRDAMKTVKSVKKLESRITVLDTYIGLIIAASLSYFTDSKSTQEMGTMIVEDLVNARWWIVFSLFVVMIICLIYIALMRWIAAPIVWFSIFGVVAILSYSIYLAYNRYAYLKANPVVLDVPITNLKAGAKSVLMLQETWLVILIAACVILVIILLAIVFLRKRIVIAIALIKEGSKAVSSVMSTLIFPIFPWIMQCLVLCLTVVVGVYLSSIGETNYKVVGMNETRCGEYKDGDACIPERFEEECGSSQNAFCHFFSVTSPMYIKALLAVDVVGFFWSIFFLEGLGEMILASTFATWYWTFNKSNVPFFTLTNGIARTFRYHLGTIAFGSLIITICRLIRLALEYVDYKIKKYDNFLTRAILCCCRCFFACLESFLKFISKNAYIMCAIHGKPFCTSARDAFSLLMRNILRVFVLDRVTDFLFFLSKVIISVGCGIAAYFAFTSPELYKIAGENLQLHYDLIPPLIVGIAAYIIASVFFSVYSMAVDTLFLCFLEDCERNDGTREKPYFMSKELMKILNKKNKIK
ncbi:choline transporter-like 2 isoform X2 [Arctopsyche grandis]|uniref:choline transporter-like 2 isoform X2 n=1 Tax=Arctopsyche grandis TaxID=121162 RepID=UPI00406D88C8